MEIEEFDAKEANGRSISRRRFAVAAIGLGASAAVAMIAVAPLRTKKEYPITRNRLLPRRSCPQALWPRAFYWR